MEARAPGRWVRPGPMVWPMRGAGGRRFVGDRAAELPDGLAERLAALRQLARTEDQQRDDEHRDQVDWRQRAHAASFEPSCRMSATPGRIGHPPDRAERWSGSSRRRDRHDRRQRPRWPPHRRDTRRRPITTPSGIRLGSGQVADGPDGDDVGIDLEHAVQRPATVAAPGDDHDPIDDQRRRVRHGPRQPADDGRPCRDGDRRPGWPPRLRWTTSRPCTSTVEPTTRDRRVPDRDRERPRRPGNACRRWSPGRAGPLGRRRRPHHDDLRAGARRQPGPHAPRAGGPGTQLAPPTTTRWTQASWVEAPPPSTSIDPCSTAPPASWTGCARRPMATAGRPSTGMRTTRLVVRSA